MLGCKIYHGPYVDNFKEIYKFLENNHISKKINSADDLCKNLINDLQNLKKESKVSNLINNYGQKTLADTIEKINYFLFNAI